ncbi:esterase, PHB depolymerase family [Rhodoferax sp. OV413]|uniref:extracellular catalytic domain type 1 short-chain-length polyhydroxyalkanoate depolymerase n=1 Tax=Rhodoferax sp. OV413 TaxID=1855285 RepID=UPI00087E6C0D|nr:PHB depolymerase family esterase [Rhodoferax sp. OV413]SDO05610.1 esterase, PHB depolymerase family [Rhodoferax sp. OV413]
MARSLSSLWLKSLTRIAKTQQNKLVRSLTAATKKATKAAVKQALAPPKPAPKPAAKRSVKPTAKTRTKPAAKPAAKSAPPAALPGSWTRSFFAAPNGQRMTYWLYLPQRDMVQSLKPLPLVVMLHGCTQTAPDFAQGTRMNQLAQRKGFAVLYPQQLVTIDAHRCWQWYQRATQNGGGEAGLVAGMVTQVVARLGLDASRVYLAGLSAGAALAQIIALRYPFRIAAVGLHSGPVFGTADNRMSAFGAMQTGGGTHVAQAVQATVDGGGFPRMPAIILHGEADKVVRIVNQQQVAQQFLRVNGIADLAPVTLLSPARPKGRNPRHAFQTQDYRVGRKPIVSVCRIAGLDHAWSGGDGTLRFNNSVGPDASALLWAFFAKHRRLRTAK